MSVVKVKLLNNILFEIVLHILLCLFCLLLLSLFFFKIISNLENETPRIGADCTKFLRFL